MFFQEVIMKKTCLGLPLLMLAPMLLSGCGKTAEKSTSLTGIYIATAVLSLLLLAFCLISVRGKEPWYPVLFSCVLIVNLGYLSLAMSDDLSQALIANRLAYLGSVFLPISMWMIIIKVTNTRHKRWFPYLLIGIGVIIFLVAASYPYSGLYYEGVTFDKTNGVTVLDKDYGPLHPTYLIYLLLTFSAMVYTIVRAALKGTVASPAYAGILAIAVFVNIGVWLTEQLVNINFEMLSISYIISECFILGLRLFTADLEKHRPTPIAQAEPSTEKPDEPAVSSEEKAAFADGINALTPKEREIFDCYVAGMNTAQVLQALSITENTLKFHNKNLYGKLGVNSRKQLLEIHKSIKKTI